MYVCETKGRKEREKGKKDAKLSILSVGSRDSVSPVSRAVLEILKNHTGIMVIDLYLILQPFMTHHPKNPNL